MHFLLLNQTFIGNESDYDDILSQNAIFESIKNRSDSEKCSFFQIMKSHFNMTEVEESGYCPYFFDNFLCWPRTHANTTVTLECPESIRGIEYESNLVTRYCNESGKWMPGNYSGCAALVPDTELPIPWIHLRLMYCIYWFGYVFSLIFLILALAVFVRYKKLWCLRNIIHCNLILCFALHNLTWIAYSLVAHEFLTKFYGLDEVAYCYIPTTILKYFIAAGFFWMFIEGVYLLFSVVFSFHAKRIRFWMCAIVGWVVPLLLLIITTIVKAKSDRTEECWNEQHHLDYIFIGPVLCILLVNVFFLVVIMYVVVTKLQVTVPVEATRYKKAIKALFILCPLLGVNYVFVLLQPNNPLWAKLVFSYYFTIMTSLQGSLVAVLFCFRNNEVWQTIRRSVRRWSRAMGIPTKAGGSGTNGSTSSQKAFRRSMRIDTQSSMMIDFETSSAGRQSRRSLGFDLTTPNGGGLKQHNRNPSKRSANVIVMRDDGELRLFLPHSSIHNGNGSTNGSSSTSSTNHHRKTTAPAKLKQDSVDSVWNHRPFKNQQQRQRQRYSLPVVQITTANNTTTTAVGSTTTSNGTTATMSAKSQSNRRSGSNYRPVRAADSIDSAQARRNRYAFNGDRTSVF